MKERLGCLSALPTFLAEAGLWDGIFSSRGKLAESDARKFARRYLASHRYGVLPAKYCGEPLDGPIKLVLELALSLLERGLWTQPSWQVEQRLAAHAEQALGWEIVPAECAPSPSGAGGGRYRRLGHADVRVDRCRQSWRRDRVA